MDSVNLYGKWRLGDQLVLRRNRLESEEMCGRTASAGRHHEPGNKYRNGADSHGPVLPFTNASG
jgi:hypothetical protein